MDKYLNTPSVPKILYGFWKVEKRPTLKHHIISKTNQGTGLKFRDVAVFDLNYSDATFESRPVIQF